jgi:hypothetical protein
VIQKVLMFCVSHTVSNKKNRSRMEERVDFFSKGTNAVNVPMMHNNYYSFKNRMRITDYYWVTLFLDF